MNGSTVLKRGQWQLDIYSFKKRILDLRLDASGQSNWDETDSELCQQVYIMFCPFLSTSYINIWNN